MKNGKAFSISFYKYNLMSLVGEQERPFEFNVEHVFGRKANCKMLELRGIWWGDGIHRAVGISLRADHYIIQFSCA